MTSVEACEADRIIREAVRGFAPRCGVDPDDAQQDAWIAVLEDLCRHPGRQLSPGWYNTVARSRVMDRVRRRVVTVAVDGHDGAVEHRTPETYALRRERMAVAARAVRAALEDLTPRERAIVLAMVEADGETCAVGTRVQQHRVRRRLAANDTVRSAIA